MPQCQLISVARLHTRGPTPHATRLFFPGAHDLHPVQCGFWRRRQGDLPIKGRQDLEIFSALDWLAQLVTHIPNRYEQMARYDGYYSNKSRGMRKKAGTDDQTLKLNSPTITPTRNCRPSILGPNNDC